VLCPPIDDFWFAQNSGFRIQDSSSSPYFLIVSSLVSYKRIELAIAAANQLGVQLKIAGSGPAEAALKKLAGSTVAFLGYQTDEQLKELYSNATATLFPGEEDFGLVPLESMACGTPVIAYRAGGALETMLEGQTGEFFDEATPESLANVMQSFDHKKYAKENLVLHAKKFSKTNFEQNLYAVIERMKSL